MTKLFDLQKALLPFLILISVLTAAAEDTPYLSLVSPELKKSSNPMMWWGQLSVQSFKPEGTFINPKGGEQNFSESSSMLMPRLDLGFESAFSPENPDSLIGGLSLGAAWGVQNMQVATYQGNIGSRLTSFQASLRPSFGKNFVNNRLRGSVLAEIGQAQLAQESSSLRISENRRVSFTGLGAELGYSFQSLQNLSLTAAAISRKSSDEQALKLAPVSLELGLKTAW